MTLHTMPITDDSSLRSGTVECAATLPRPLELMILGPALDGSHGYFRCPPSHRRIAMSTDIHAILTWLSQSNFAPDTYFSYRHAAECLLLWSVIEKQRPLSSLDSSDLAEYWLFLKDPMPRAKWLRQGRIQRDDVRWRPFKKPLSDASAAGVIGILNSMFNWLVTNGYVVANPVTLQNQTANQIKAIARERTRERWRSSEVCTTECWNYIVQALDDIRDDKDRAISKLILYFAYFAGLRAEPISSLKFSSMSINPPPFSAMTILTEAHSDRCQKIYALPPIVDAYEEFLKVSLNYGAVLDSTRTSLWPWLRSTDESLSKEGRPIPRRIYYLSKNTFMLAAAAASAMGDSMSASLLERMTLGKLRHSFEVRCFYTNVAPSVLWKLTGANRTLPRSLRVSARRVELDDHEVDELFEQLKGLWPTRASKPVPKVQPGDARLIAQLTRENELLRHKLDQADMIIDVLAKEKWRRCSMTTTDMPGDPKS